MLHLATFFLFPAVFDRAGERVRGRSLFGRFRRVLDRVPVIVVAIVSVLLPDL
jgi:hypothetical protein